MSPDSLWRRLVACVAGLFLLVPSFAAAAAQERFSIVTTIAQIADPVAHIVGDRAEVESLLGSGVDPHTYRLTRSDIAKLGHADIIFYNGFYLEAQMEETLAQMAHGKPVIALAEKLPEDELLASQNYPGRHDPHVWMDVALWMRVVEAARDALIAHDSAGESVYTANTATYLKELTQLQAYAKQTLATVPMDSRVLVTAHDAFNYFGKAYEFDVVGIQGISTESEAGLYRIESLVNLLIDRNVGAVFFESSVSPRNIRALIDGAAVRGHTVRIGGELFSDAMGPPDSYEGTYIGMLDHNITIITRALGGEAPARGLNGQLKQGTG